MPSTQRRGMAAPDGLPVVDETNVDAFLTPAAGEAQHALLLFAAVAQARPETADVLVVVPELLRHFEGRLRGAVVAADAETKLKSRFQAYAAPSLVVTRGGDPVGVLPKIHDWSVYIEKIEAWLSPDAPALAPPKIERRADVAFTQRS